MADGTEDMFADLESQRAEEALRRALELTMRELLESSQDSE